MKHFQWHPMMVHFPLALTIAGAGCLLLVRILKDGPVRQSLAMAGTWNLILGGGAALLTLGTGYLAVLDLKLLGGAQYSVSRHMIWAVSTSQLVVLLALWRSLAVKWDSAPSAWFLLLLTVACAGFIVTGYYGGENVYHYALGVAKP